jgi:glycosyltransferase involved in cell wall biosynthesis
MLITEAKRQKIKTLGMASGWDHLDKYFLPFQSDNLLAQSSHIEEMAIKYQCYSPQKISVIGYPHLDFVSNPKYALLRKDFLKTMDIPENAKYILYISGSAYCPDEPDVIETILKWIDEGKFGAEMHMIIRPYLGGRGADRDFDKKKFEKFEEHPKIRFWKREAWDDLPNSINFMNIMRHANVVISIFTTAVLEAAVFDVPLITTVFDGYNQRPYHRSIRRFLMSEHFQDVLDTKAMKITNNFDELFEAIIQYLRNPKLDSNNRQVMREKLLYKLDGRASERILHSILKVLA